MKPLMIEDTDFLASKEGTHKQLLSELIIKDKNSIICYYLSIYFHMAIFNKLFEIFNILN